MICYKCGAELDDNAIFCNQCGAKMEGAPTVDDIEASASVESVVETSETAINEVVETVSEPKVQVAPMPIPVPVTPQPQAVQQPVTPQPQMAQPVYNNGMGQVDPREQPMTIMGWLGTMLVMCIPIVGIVMYFVWLFSGNTNKSKKNLLIAYLILTVVMIVLMIVFGAALSAILLPLLGDMDWETVTY